MAISTIRAIIKKSQVTGDVNNLPGKGLMFIWTLRTLMRMVQVANESPRITDGEFQTLVRSWGQNISQTTVGCHVDDRKLLGRAAGRNTSFIIATASKTTHTTLLNGPNSDGLFLEYYTQHQTNSCYSYTSLSVWCWATTLANMYMFKHWVVEVPTVSCIHPMQVEYSHMEPADFIVGMEVEWHQVF